MDDYQRYKSAVRWLERLNKTRSTKQFMLDRSHPEHYLQRMRALLELLGNPDREIKYIHITGTAGKGTVSTMVHNGLAAAGKRVGLFTSPYCVTVAENIQVNGRLISVNEFSDLVDRVRKVLLSWPDHRRGGTPPTGGAQNLTRPSYFEMLLAIAFLYFKKKQCEWVVLEVGLGGRYDATNVIATPRVCAITNIGFDHIKILGPTLSNIARDKAGIIKSGSIFFTTEHRAPLRRLFHDTCRRVGAQFNVIAQQEDSQATNRILAQSILESLPISSVAIKEAINTTRLPCRFEIVAKNPMIILDGAHNLMKIAALFEQIRAIPHQRLIVVLGVLNDKDLNAIARRVARSADHVVLTQGTTPPLFGRHWASLSTLSDAFPTHTSLIITKQKSPMRALAFAQQNVSPRDIILVTGSFYLTGELRKQWYSEKKILRSRSSFLTR